MDETGYKENIKNIKENISETRGNINKKKELVMKYKKILQHKSRRNISLASLATKLSYELSRAKQLGLQSVMKQELEALKDEAKDDGISQSYPGSDMDEYGNKIRKNSSDEDYDEDGRDGEDDRLEDSEGQNRESRGSRVNDDNSQRDKRSGYNDSQGTGGQDGRSSKGHRNESGQIVDKRPGKPRAENLYRRINKIYLRDLDIFYTFKDC